MRCLWEHERRQFLAGLSRLTRHKARRQAEMLVLYDTGCRVGELVALDRTDYDRGRSSLLIMNIKAAGRPRREVPLHPRTVRALNRYLAGRTDDHPALFVAQSGGRLGVRTAQDDYALCCRLAGVPCQGIHTLRHAAATRLLDERVLEPHQVARRLGHRSVQTTMAFYVHGDVALEAQRIRSARL